MFDDFKAELGDTPLSKIFTSPDLCTAKFVGKNMWFRIEEKLPSKAYAILWAIRDVLLIGSKRHIQFARIDGFKTTAKQVAASD